MSFELPDLAQAREGLDSGPGDSSPLTGRGTARAVKDAMQTRANIKGSRGCCLGRESGDGCRWKASWVRLRFDFKPVEESLALVWSAGFEPT